MGPSRKPNAETASPLDVHVGKRIRARRLFMEKSETWLAAKFGTTVEHIEACEQGRTRVSASEIYELSRILDVAVRYFFQGYQPVAVRDVQPWVRDVDRWFASELFPHERALVKAARKLTGEPEMATDLVQEAYAQILRDDKWRGIDNGKAYAFRVIKSLGLRLLQRTRIVPIQLLSDIESVTKTDQDPDAFDIVSATEQRKLLMAAIDALPPQCRRVVKMRRLEEMTIPQIAGALNLSVRTVENHLARGLATIARKMTAADEDTGVPTDPSK